MKRSQIFGWVAFSFLQIVLFSDSSAVTSASNLVLSQKKHILIIDFKNVAKIPGNFRSTWKDISRIPTNISILGLKDLNIAGSQEFSELGLKAVYTENPIITAIVDLRQETHFFVDGNAVTLFSSKDWGNKGLSDNQILYNEKILFETLGKENPLILQGIYHKDPKNSKLFKTYSIEFNHPIIQSEEDVVKNQGFSYVRLFVTDDMVPSPKEVDRFIKFVKTLPLKTGFYFHCRNGKGRTTTFMALYDMMHNAKTVSFKDIIKRQFYLGGVDLFNVKKSGYERALNLQRIKFLRQFYEYAKENTDDFSTLWSHFLNR